MNICNQLVQNVKNYGFQTRPRVVRHNFCKGRNPSWKRDKKEPKVKQKFWGKQVLFWTKCLKFVPKRVNLTSLTPMYSTVNCTSATSYNYDATITFFVVAQHWTTSDAPTIDISCSTICIQPPVQLTGLLGVWMQHGDLKNFIMTYQHTESRNHLP